MAGFNKRIVVNNKTFDFEFMEIYSPSGSKYFITVRDSCKQIAFFEMKKIESGWTIVPPVPEWINEVESNLVLAIANNTY